MTYVFVYIIGLITIPAMLITHIALGIKDYELAVKRLKMLKAKLPSLLDEIKNEIH